MLKNQDIPYTFKLTATENSLQQKVLNWPFAKATKESTVNVPTQWKRISDRKDVRAVMLAGPFWKKYKADHSGAKSLTMLLRHPNKNLT